MAEDPYRYFRIEARELVDQIAQGVLEAEDASRRGGEDDGPSHVDVVAQLLRVAHTLKGAARVVKQPDIADRAHEMEDLLDPYRDGAGPVSADDIEALLRLTDSINDRLLGLDSPPPATVEPAPAAVGPDPPPEPGPSAPPGPDVSSAPAATVAGPADAGPGAEAAPRRVPSRDSLPALRADMADVDEVLDTIGEAHAQLTPLRRSLATLERAGQRADMLVELLAAPALRRQLPGAEGIESSHDQLRSIAADLTVELTGLSRSLTRTVEQTARELQQVRNSAERLRLVAAASMFPALRRAVRDVADEQDKRVSFEGRGGDVRLDPKVLTEVHNALLHAVRNAVAHGTEPAADRLAAGKPPVASVVVEIARRGSWVAFSCHDDGAGFDLDAVRRALWTRDRRVTGTTTDRAYDDDELWDHLLRGGISTSSTVDEVSGRGVGLDVVRDVAERLGGEVTVHNEPGRGATVSVVVPLSLMSLEGLVVGSAGVTTAIPLDSVRLSMRVRPEEIAYAATGATVIHGGEAIPYLSLAAALSLEESRSEGQPAVPFIGLVVAGESGTAMIGLDRLFGTETVVVRPLAELAAASEVVGGVSLDGEGNPRLVLDPDGLVAAAYQAGGGSAPASAEHELTHVPMLVIDDSLTSRMLEQSILESAGYTVDVAGSGEEALDKARRTRYSLFLVDVEMPGIDGYTFIERAADDVSLRDIPAIVVSSQASPEDLARGREVGARMHVDKRQFDQNELLDRIRELVA